MSMKSFEIEANVMVECVGKYVKGSAAIFNHAFGNYMPGDPEEVSNFKVYINVHGSRIDITNAITAEERTALINAFVDNCRFEQKHEEDWAMENLKNGTLR